MKTFYSLEDIEKLAAQGVRELTVDEDAVLTDLARDAAAQLGVRLVSPGPSAAAKASTPIGSDGNSGSSDRPAACQHAPLSEPAVTSGSSDRPRGCQHGPLTGPAPAPAAARTGGTATDGLVNDLVGAVKNLASKPSGG